jgi:hypothetical protein
MLAMRLKRRQEDVASGDAHAAASDAAGGTASLRLPNRFAFGIKISGRMMEATSTYGSVMVSGKLRVVTRKLRRAQPQHAADGRIAAPE